MSWQEEMKAAVVMYILNHGMLVKEGERERFSYSGWEDYGPGWSGTDNAELREHVFECGMTSLAYDDSEWDEFDGTFAEPPWSTRKGIDATVTCTCTLVENRTWRYTGTMGDLLRAITG